MNRTKFSDLKHRGDPARIAEHRRAMERELSPAKLSVLIGTTGRRPEMLAQVVAAIQAEPQAAEILIDDTDTTIGAKGNALTAQATGDYWLLCCDDTVPHPGWFSAARAVLATGRVPACRLIELDGTVTPTWPGLDGSPDGTEVPWSRMYLLTPALWAAAGGYWVDSDWYSDIEFGERLTAAGYPIVVCSEFAFTHLDGARDWQTQDANDRDRSAIADARRSRSS